MGLRGDHFLQENSELIASAGVNRFMNETIALEFGLEACQWSCTNVIYEDFGRNPDFFEGDQADKIFGLGLNFGVQFFLK